MTDIPGGDKGYGRRLCEPREDEEDSYAFANAAAEQRAIATDDIWTLFWYPDIPAGFYASAVPSLEDLLTLVQQVTTEKSSLHSADSLTLLAQATMTGTNPT